MNVNVDDIESVYECLKNCYFHILGTIYTRCFILTVACAILCDTIYLIVDSMLLVIGLCLDSSKQVDMGLQLDSR